MKERTNTQISVSFGKDEIELLKSLDLLRKDQMISRSGWIKQKIREDIKRRSLNVDLVGG
jgi:metal-responsive CopG/Arc/MetJ family transcriptional regulator|tara:strand:- start:55 stop:234 length:180 start_codon:yes stop_codon:yes gene_type:complete